MLMTLQDLKQLMFIYSLIKSLTHIFIIIISLTHYITLGNILFLFNQLLINSILTHSLHHVFTHSFIIPSLTYSFIIHSPTYSIMHLHVIQSVTRLLLHRNHNSSATSISIKTAFLIVYF